MVNNKDQLEMHQIFTFELTITINADFKDMSI